MALPLRCPKRTHSHQRSDQKRRVFRDLSILGKGALCASHSPFFTSHKGTSQKSAEFAPANLPFQIQANTLRTGECSLRISLFFPLFPASLPQVPLSLVPCATTCAVLAEPQGSSRKGRNVARGGLGLGGGLGKEQELHVDLYLVWGRSRGSVWVCTWFGEGRCPAVVVELQRSWQDLVCCYGAPAV